MQEKNNNSLLYSVDEHEDTFCLIYCIIQWKYILSLWQESSVDEKSALKWSQGALEWQLTNKQDTHPYCLSLDCILNCIQGLVAEGGLNKERK